MAIAGESRRCGRRWRAVSYLLAAAAAAILILPMLQVWFCGSGCTVSAVRLLPGDYATRKPGESDDSSTVKSTILSNKKISREETLYRFFNGRRDLNFNETTKKELEDSKRRVPSCPDPLHN